MKRFIVLCFAIITLFASVLAEIVPPLVCTDDESVNCEITELRVSPCKEVKKNAPCKFRKNSNAHLEVEFTPNFVASNLTAQMYWTQAIDVPLLGMDMDACKTTTCPTVAGEKNTYTYDLLIQSFPAGKYSVKLIIADIEKPEANKCCLIYKINLPK